jgi:hypothetical protein
MDKNYPTWRVGQRVKRKDSDEQGTVLSVSEQIKVKWDSGATSYFTSSEPMNVRLIPSN